MPDTHSGNVAEYINQASRLSPVVRKAITACAMDFMRMMSDRDYCCDCPLLEPCSVRDKWEAHDE